MSGLFLCVIFHAGKSRNTITEREACLVMYCEALRLPCLVSAIKAVVPRNFNSLQLRPLGPVCPPCTGASLCVQNPKAMHCCRQDRALRCPYLIGQRETCAFDPLHQGASSRIEDIGDSDFQPSLLLNYLHTACYFANLLLSYLFPSCQITTIL
jgi:hypothetical protein